MVPKLKMFVGPMFSGKSTKLIQNIERYKLAGHKILCFKPSMDNRYTSEGYIVTHNDMHENCYLINTGDDLTNVYEEQTLENDIKAIAIDEAFMIDDIEKAILKIFYRDRVDFLVSSIDISASLLPFECVSNLLSHATHVKKCKAVCTSCGEDASYTMRKFSIDEKEEEIRVGGIDLYEPKCLKHHNNICF